MKQFFKPNVERQINKKRSTGVVVFGLLLILTPLSNILISILLYHRIQQLYLSIFFSFISVISGIGILLLKEWARKLVVILATLAIFVSLTSFFIIPEVIFKSIFKLIVNIWMFIYGSLLLYFFTRPKVKERFIPKEIIMSSKTKILIGVLVVGIVLIGGWVVSSIILQKQTIPEEVMAIVEIKSNFKNYNEKEVSIYTKEIELLQEPLDPKSNDCMFSSVPPIECKGIWRYSVSDKTDHITIFSGGRLKTNTIVKGRFAVSCNFFVKTMFSCEIKDHYCECIVEGRYNQPIKVDLSMSITTDSAYQLFKK